LIGNMMKRRLALCWALALLLAVLFTGCGLMNQLPVIQSVQIDSDQVYAGDSVSIECLASDPDGDDISYRWLANGGTISGEGSSVSWVAPSVPGTYTVTITVTDENGSYATESVFINVLPNEPPIIEELSASVSLVRFGDSVAIECVASDPDGDEISYQWSTNGGTISGDGPSVTWTAPDATGSYTVRVAAGDGHGGEVTSSLVINVRLNEPPVIQELSVETNPIGLGDSVAIECVASDPDGDEISYQWSANGGTISGDGPGVTWTTPDTAGSYTVTVRVSDSRDSVSTAELVIEALPNNPPVISALKAEKTSVMVGESTVIRCDAFDPDGDVLTYTWTAGGGELSGGGPEVSWTALGECGEQVTVSVTVSDDLGAESSKDVILRVKRPG
jgi:hypothetical protein